jgi:hypothetical protein
MGQPGIALKEKAHHQEAGMKIKTRAISTNATNKMMSTMLHQPIGFFVGAILGAGATGREGTGA